MAFKFEKLKVWHAAVELSTAIHQMVQNWPAEERYVLSSQIKRASDSIALNIAEGSTGQTNKEFSRLLGIALRSGIEVVSCIYLAKARGLIDEVQFESTYTEIETLIIKIQSLRKYINNTSSVSEPSGVYETMDGRSSTDDSFEL